MPTTLDITLLSLRVALVSTLWIAVPGVAMGYLLARGRFRGKALVQALIALPMVLPPVAIGLLLLRLLARDSFVGDFLAGIGMGSLLLTWKAAAIASAVMAFPLLVIGARQGFESVPRRIEQVAETLGISRRTTFFRVTMPLALRGILYGLVLAFARALGEFGATSIVAGHIPGETETLSLAIHSRIENFDDAGAWRLSVVALVLALLFTSFAEYVLRRKDDPR